MNGTPACALEARGLRVRRADRLALQGVSARFAPGTWTELKKLKRALYDNMYKHERVMQVMDAATIVVRDLFEAITHDPELLPPQHRHREEIIARAVADYIAGMTDRFAINMHRQLTGKTLLAYGV